MVIRCYPLLFPVIFQQYPLLRCPSLVLRFLHPPSLPSFVQEIVAKEIAISNTIDYETGNATETRPNDSFRCRLRKRMTRNDQTGSCFDSGCCSYESRGFGRGGNCGGHDDGSGDPLLEDFVDDLCSWGGEEALGRVPTDLEEARGALLAARDDDIHHPSEKEEAAGQIRRGRGADRGEGPDLAELPEDGCSSSCLVWLCFESLLGCLVVASWFGPETAAAAAAAAAASLLLHS